MTRLIPWLVSPLGAATTAALLALALFAASLPLARIAPRLAAIARRTGAGLLALGLAAVLVPASSAVARALAKPLETKALALAADAPPGPYDAIVVLGGAVQAPPEHPAARIRLLDASDRVWHAARLWHERVAPTIVASGGPLPAPGQDLRYPEAEAMRDVLEAFGVPRSAIVVEPRSANTRENVRFTAALIGRGRKVALVTSAIHMPRALRDARAAGLDAHAFPTDFRTLDRDRPLLHPLHANTEALDLSGRAMKEWLGEFAARLGVAPTD